MWRGIITLVFVLHSFVFIVYASVYSMLTKQDLSIFLTTLISRLLAPQTCLTQPHSACVYPMSVARRYLFCWCFFLLHILFCYGLGRKSSLFNCYYFLFTSAHFTADYTLLVSRKIGFFHLFVSLTVTPLLFVLKSHVCKT